MCSCDLRLSSGLGVVLFLQTVRNVLQTFPTAPKHSVGLLEHGQTYAVVL